MLTRIPFRQFSKLTSEKRTSRLYRWLDAYEDFVGLKEVKQAQTTVNDAERQFLQTQTERRSYSDELMKLQNELARIRFDMEKLSRSDDAYFELFKTEHELVKKEKSTQLELKKQDEIERRLFSSLQLALRESQEKEKMRVERTKYWSIIGSVVGALAGMIGATISNRYRMKEFRDITNDSQKLYEDLIIKQEASINELKKELTSLSSSNDSFEHILLLNEQSEQRLQSNLIHRTGVLRVNPFRLQLNRLSSAGGGVNTNRYTGIVKRFSKEKGFGFIKRDTDGQDVFVHFQAILGTGFKTLNEGQQVEFQVSDGTKGPEARDVVVKNATTVTSDKPMKSLSKDRYTGVIRKFVKNRGFGFITRKSDGADVFMHSRWIHPSDLEHLHEGMEVDFLESESDRGLEARDIRIVESLTNGQKNIETGTIQQWNTERGFGFVRRASTGKDLFVHARSLVDGMRTLDVGQQIQFQLRSTGKGEEACDVRLIENKQNESLTKK
ncbi:unnamed protein product [Adineta ricciae]|uniref:CSD domain-containing protein n=1 Tax=Adineta ricciae TaxID=249248 RepID=A0A814I345_ADIRI|nr:unnamed protein product [Adineta ricciae]CAF1620439.1 unnamed protein product [Adineta ricciae]